MLVDIHVRTERTEGSRIRAEEAVRRGEALGLDGICFADRDTLGSLEEVHSLRQSTSLALFVGVEISSDHGALLCFFPEPTEVGEPASFLGPRPEAGWPVREVVSRVREKGGVVIAARPYDRSLERPMGDFVFTLDGFSAIEGLCGTQPSDVNELGIEAADQLSLPCVGGSCAGELEEVGRAAALFRDEFRDEGGLVRAIQDGKVWAVAVGKPPKFHGDRLAARAREDRGRHRRGRRGG